MRLGFVLYGGLDNQSGGFRYDRQLVSFLEAAGDDVEIVALPWRTYSRQLTDSLSRTVRTAMDLPVDVLIQDELCYPSLWRHNRHLDEPTAIVSLVHLLGPLRPRSTPTSLGIWRPVARQVERRYLESVDAAICTSRHTESITSSYVDGPTLVAPPAGRIEGAALDRQSVRDRATDSGSLRICIVGNLIPRKDVRTLCTALARVNSPWELTIVGSTEEDSSYVRSVRSHVRSLGIDESITWTGQVSDERLADIYKSHHVLAVPAKYEGFGMVYLEAMEYGVVPIASANGGASEIVTDGTNGYLIEPTDPETLASILTRLTNDREHLSSLAVSGLETARAHPSWDETMGTIRQFLLDIFARSTEIERGERPEPTGEGNTNVLTDVRGDG